ncbi:hypothetical protein ACWEOW_16635 [Monashia sp. NPDC004114]
MSTAPDRARPEDRALISVLAQSVLAQAAPDELPVFDETAEDYFDDPAATLRPHGRDEPVGFGIDIALLTPYVLAVATPVIQLIVGLVSDAVHTDSRSVLAPLVRRLLRLPEPSAEGAADAGAGAAATAAASAGEAPLALTTEQARQIHDVALERGRSLGLVDELAALLADAVVGGLVVAR